MSIIISCGDTDERYCMALCKYMSGKKLKSKEYNSYEYNCTTDEYRVLSENVAMVSCHL